ncbi:dihydrodipicolinate synthase family protein [Phytohabitans kaempferiae]|uniref:Dihydrodipicolinate synthase family protein n=1 Tax=Phytohabitans kaempferiae TaxID=1620943 RepID=A0ABV6LUT4_9ACTN
MLHLHGVIPPVITPLTPEDEVDVEAIHRLTDHLVDAGVTGLFVLGSSGEGPALTPAQREETVRAFVKAARGRVPVLAGIGEPSVRRAVEALEVAAAAGAAAVVATAPYYFLHDDRHVADHLVHIAGATDLPVVLYNIPPATHSVITPSILTTVVRQAPNVVAIKDSSGDWDAFQGMLEAARQLGVAVLQGAEALIGRSMLAGAAGAVPGIANLTPAVACALVRAGKDGAAETVDALQAALDRACEVYRPGYWLAGLKAAVAQRGLCTPHPARGLPRLDPAAAALVATAAVAAIADEERHV